MANADRPNGLHPVRHLMGSPIVANEYSVDSSNATAIFPGDVVIMEADGKIAPYTGTGGGNVLGVMAGLKDVSGNLSLQYLAASTAGTVLVYDDPYIIFEAQEDDGGTALAATSVGANVDLLATAGSTTTQNSRHELDRSTIATTTAQCRLLRLVPRVDNAYGDWARWEVILNEHGFRDTAGV